MSKFLKDKPPLIKSYHVGAGIAASVEAEINRLNTETSSAFIELKREGNDLTLVTRHSDIALLAMNVAKIMSRKVWVFSEAENGEVVKYASPTDIESVLTSLKEHAQQTSTNAALAIDRLIGVTKQIARV